MPREADDVAPIRAFIAVELGEAARRAAARILASLRAAPDGDGVRWVRAEALHVTLYFLGDVEPAALAALVAGVAGQTAPLAPFRVALGGVCGFPSPRRPRVVALGLAPEAPLVELAAAVGRGAAEAGFPLERRPYRPHLTLGRVRAGRAWRGVTDPVTAEGQTFDVAEVVLFRSDLQREGARHTPLERIALGGGSIHP